MRLAGVHPEDQAPSEDCSGGSEEGEIKESPRPPRMSFSSTNIADGGVPPTMCPAGVHHEDQALSEDCSGGSEEGEIKEFPRPPRTSFSSTNLADGGLPPVMRLAGVHHEDQALSEDCSGGSEEGEIKESPRPPRTSFSSSNIADGGVPLPHTKNPRSDLSTAAVDSVDHRRVRQRIHLHSAGKSPRPLRCVGSPDAVYSSALVALDDRLIKRSVEKKSNLAPMTLVSVVSGEAILTSSVAAKNRSGELVTASPRPPRTSFSSSNIADGGVPLPHTKNPRSDMSTAAVDSIDHRSFRQRIHLHSAGKSPRPLRCVGSPDAVYSSALVALDDRRIKRSVAKKSNLVPMTLVSVVSGEPILTSSIAAKKRSGELVTASCSSPADDWVSCRLAVRHARILFDSLRTHYLRVSGGGAPRPDQKAARAMKDRGMWLHRDYRIVGDIPGLLIGDVFFYRSELQVLGLHGVPQGGIDYVPVDVSSIGDPIATSIIVSGGYEDDVDNGNELIYTGQGGKERGHSRLNADQKLRAGNLALIYNKQKDMKVRVIRGFPYDDSPTGKVYVYDGLYTLLDFWTDNSKSGFSAYKYHFRRAEGQPPMGSSVFKFAEELRARKHPNGYLSWDISGGAEGANPVRLFNDIDCDNEPLFFEYRSRPYLPKNVLVCRSSMKKMGCSCSGVCSLDCECSQKNGGAMPYDLHGILLRGKPMIYECGPSCPCSGSCPNRVSQKGLRYKLEVFRSLSIGWGVRSLDAIRAGAFICEFSGDVLPIDGEATNSTYMVWPGQFPPRWAEWRDISEVFPDKSLPKISGAIPWSGFGLDLSRARNVGCYLGHSKIPNAFVQPVLYDHDYQSRPHLMVFAMENIPPLTELSIDYGDQDGVVDKEGKFAPF